MDTRIVRSYTIDAKPCKSSPRTAYFPEEKDEESDKEEEKTLRMIAVKARVFTFLVMLRRADPRYRILHFFLDVSHDGIGTSHGAYINNKKIRYFDKKSVFTIWRPCSSDAIRKMIMGLGVGKGLDIKGKSAKQGVLSGFVPFVQIHDNNHKKELRMPSEVNLVRVFYKSKSLRDEAWKLLFPMKKKMEMTADGVNSRLQSAGALSDNLHSSFYSVKNKLLGCGTAEKIDEYAPNTYGIELPEKLLWETCVICKDIRREGKYQTGRVSEPAFQEMNFHALRNGHVEGVPRAVLMQYSDDDPLCPLNLLMAYEENNRVLPVVSDLDCLLVGTRRVKYGIPLPPEQVELLKWSVNNTEKILNDAPSTKSWTSRWLDVLKEEAHKESPYKPKMPRFGFGDPTSYRLMEGTIQRLTHDGAVRHGAECFNYYFPQEMDEQFLIISSSIPVCWKYVNKDELIDFLCERASEGFTFPLNPKWILCDKGMKRVYDRLMASDCPIVQESLDVWYPKQSGVRAQIERVHMQKPNGYIRCMEEMSDSQSLESSTHLIDLAQHELKHYTDFHRVKRRLKGMLKTGMLTRRHLSTCRSFGNNAESEKDEIDNFDSN